MKQTAVEWLFFMLNNPNRDQEFAHKLFEKAKEIEKQQIVQAHRSASKDAGYEHSADDWAKEYYDKTFNK